MVLIPNPQSDVVAISIVSSCYRACFGKINVVLGKLVTSAIQTLFRWYSTLKHIISQSFATNSTHRGTSNHFLLPVTSQLEYPPNCETLWNTAYNLLFKEAKYATHWMQGSVGQAWAASLRILLCCWLWLCMSMVCKIIMSKSARGGGGGSVKPELG